MSGGNSPKNPFAFGKTSGSQAPPGGFFSTPVSWGPKATESSTTGQLNEQTSSLGGETRPLLRPSIFGQSTTVDSSQIAVGNTTPIASHSIFLPSFLKQATETDSTDVWEAKAGIGNFGASQEGPFPTLGAEGDNIFGQPNKPRTIFSSNADEKAVTFDKTGATPSVFGETIFGRSLEANRTLQKSDGNNIFGGVLTVSTSIGSTAIFGKALKASTEDQKNDDVIFGKIQAGTPLFGPSIFGKAANAIKEKEAIFGKKHNIDTPSIFGQNNLFGKVPEATTSRETVQKDREINLFQGNTATKSTNIFGVTSSSHVHQDEVINSGAREVGHRSSATSHGFGTEIKASDHQEAVRIHQRDPRTVRPGLFGQALGDLLKGAPKKIDTTTTSASPSEIQTLLSLYVSDVPNELFDKSVLLKHFSQYGTVSKILLSAARKSCSVKFEDHEMAEKAKTHGGIVGNIPLHIFWAKAGSLGHTERRPLKVFQNEGESRRPRSKSNREMQPAKPKGADMRHLEQRSSSGPSLYDLEDDVQAELNSMLLANTSSFSNKLPPIPQPKENRGSKFVPRPVSTLSRSKRRSSPLSLREPSASRVTADAEVPFSVSSATLDELTKVMRSPAHSAEERYRVLEARDKMMRMKRVRQSDLAKARINRGTCPDMCPEKERYHREFQRQVAAYEFASTPGKIDHRNAIKQYSRSSADQEEPLSHELRPASALRLTMDYLMWKIMDICDNKDENMTDWYHYIWDRTRGIRKDITQQELSDESSVELVEQCARWHIFCSERLISEDLSTYDDNINTENLTKCLQTLKYMYLDLSLKGISCQNEAEFRAYFVMLNLNEGDCMWEVQQLSSEIRESEPVRFALQVSMALASNNYIRFFKLVRSTTYLNACILHRYFAQVRSQALQTMVKAFCSRAKETVFTLEEVVSLAGFENAEEAATLCPHHGLNLTQDRRSVVFSRNTFYLPDSALPAIRVLSLVDAKRTCSVGSVVSGGSEPSSDFEAHVPHDSFGEGGVLKSRAWTAEDQETDEIPSAVGERELDVEDDQEGEMPEEQQQTQEGQQRQEEDGSEAIMREAIMQKIHERKCEHTVNVILDAVVNDEVCSIVEVEMKAAFVDSAADSFNEEIFEAVTEEIVTNVCTKELTAAIAAEQEEVRQKRLASEAEMLRKMREKRFLQELNRYLDEFILECVEQVMSDEKELEEWQKKATEDLVEEFLNEECRQIARESIAAAQLAEVDAIYARSQKRQLKLYFKQWQAFVVKSKLRKQSMADFPAWMSNLSLDEQAAPLTQPDPYLIKNMNRIRYASNKSKLHALEQEPPPIPMLHVATAISAHISARMKEVSCHDAYLYWKLVLSSPNSQEAPRHSSVIKRWTKQIFSLDDDTPMRISRISPNSYETLTVCVRSVTDYVLDGNECQGANGILFWLSHKDKSLVEARRRLSRILSTLRKVPAIPVGVVLTGPMPISDKQIHKELDLVQLRASKQVSYYKVFPRTVNTSDGLQKQVQAACQWLAELASPPPPVLVTSMRKLMYRCLTEELWGLVKPARKNQDPNTMIELYNQALQKVKEMLCDDSLSEYSLGATEFKTYLEDDSRHEQRQFQIAPTYWGSQKYYECINKILSEAELPMIQPWPPENNTELKDVIVQYCRTQGLTKVISTVFRLIEQQARMRHRSSYPPAQPANWQSFLKSISWCSVIQTIVEAKLNKLDYNFVLLESSEFEVAVHLRGFHILQAWLIEHLYILDLKDSSVELCCNEDKTGQKRSLEEEVPTPSKQRKLSLVEIYSNIRASLNRLDLTMSSVRSTWQGIDKEMTNE